MNDTAMTTKKVAVIGTGVIGNGWIARFLATGFEVTAFDPANGAEAKSRQNVSDAWSAIEETGMTEDADQSKLSFAPTIEEAVKGAVLIQENVPERSELKQNVLAEIDRHADTEAMIGSSTSGIIPTELQMKLQHPERFFVSHPFNPVYLLPLVELVGGKQTDRGVLEKAKEFFAALKMKPLIIEKEVEGHVADRLMEALWREALHLVNDGVATTKEIDDAITYGAGLRWAQFGPFMTFHLAGGDQGMRHMLEQFGPALQLPWTKLEAPQLTDELKERVITGCESHADGRSVAELEEKRNEFLVKLLRLVEEYRV
ncbi:3-hydroxyacyl-CoA dehydrogenase NAD-binding domain-containing protein [Salisediminibacterium halotolerans]|uniref:L-carnitine dehydrogenase n=1 Tax=Salisediminibacterium halotolerans TaxID=517425 RepID=A0A1H9R5A9_9BACI|nr:3-hydroxyacyl-CoA dehydrogenase NAD-binding domain-containing protein [Salisediminibacterium haloalkalitolerans]SER67906.1 carnitine 3-dehydrogenase [Salisediminibacterium haloalkalitolerans]